ncbi:MAG: GNAT family N-acetyltransferase [Parabacteroides sp.]|nr:GNAT family N-acetyltransferase [Parabacteroides sp.]
MNENIFITCECVSDVSQDVLNQVERTYTDSFPEVERRDFSLVRQLIQESSSFKLFVFRLAGTYAGFLTTWDFGSFVYAEHFAISSEQRNGGIGSRALRSYLDSLQKPLILEVELPTDHWSRRRIGFYERLGFTLDAHRYVQPPYRPGGEELEMRLMSYGAIDLAASFDKVCRTIHRNVYGVE